VKTPRKQAPRATISLHLPAATLRELRAIARTSGCTLDDVFAVIVATKLVQLKRKGRAQ